MLCHVMLMPCFLFFLADTNTSPAVRQSQQETLRSRCEDVFSDVQDFLWGMIDDDVDEGELVKAAIARSLEQDIRPADDIKLVESLDNFRQQVKDQETCEIVVLRKRLLRTCLKAVTDSSFDFFKIPLIHFSCEEAEDYGGPRREFFRLLMKKLGSEFGVFEGNESALLFSHSHAVLEQRKPFITGQLVAWSILHNGPGFHAMSEDVYYLMLQLPQHINIPRAIEALSDEETKAIAKELLGSTDAQAFVDIKDKYMNWLLDHGITIHNRNREDMCSQVIKETLFYR